MPPKRKKEIKASAAPKKKRKQRKNKRDRNTPAPSSTAPDWPELYRRLVTLGMPLLRQDNSAIDTVSLEDVWAARSRRSNTSSSSTADTTGLTTAQLSQLAAVLLSHQYQWGGIPDESLALQDEAAWASWCADTFASVTISATNIHCFTILWSVERAHDLLRPYIAGGIVKCNGKEQQQQLYAFMPTRYRELYMKQHGLPFDGVTQMSGEKSSKDEEATMPPPEAPFVVRMIQHVLHLMEGDTLQVKQTQNQQKRRAAATMEQQNNSSNAANNTRDEIEDEEAQQQDDTGSDDLDGEANADDVYGFYNDECVQGTDNDEQQEATGVAAFEPKPGRTSTKSTKAQDDAWKLIHRALELLIDLLSSSSDSDSDGLQFLDHLVPYLESIHWTVRCRTAVGMSRYSTASPHHLLTQQLLERVTKAMHTKYNNNHGGGGGVFPRVRMGSPSQQQQQQQPYYDVYHKRAGVFQKMCHRYYPEQLSDVVHAGVGLLCSSSSSGGGRSYLRQALDGLTDEEFGDLMHAMRLVDKHGRPESYSRTFLLAVLEEYLVVPPDPLEELQSFPLYPTEGVLWDLARIPPSQSNLLSSPVLSLPKLQTRFVSFTDYLSRNFELMRLESAYEIRSDLTDCIKRVQPIVRQAQVGLDQSSGGGGSGGVDDDSGMVIQTEFSGWARMALELVGNLAIQRVDKPLLGERYPSRVLAEITVDLGPCGETIRREWDELGEYDNLFLVAIDAQKMSGKPAPLLHDFHMQQVHDSNFESKDSTSRVPDEDDRTFPERYGVTLVRGCMILQVRDEAGTVLNDPSAEAKPSGAKRIFRVALDPTQFSADQKSSTGTEIYNGLNLVVRRHGKTNNFRSVLETIRGLMAGSGSINRVIPSWLQSVLLGQGDPNKATYQSETVKAYARETAGVANPDAYLDYGDTFLSQEHLVHSFGEEVAVQEIVDDKDKGKSRYNFRVRMIETEGSKPNLEAMPYPFPKGISGNQVAFTKSQVSAIRAGLSPGLSLIVGPPGTGKTDVAVQIIASLYHSFSTQRTIVLAHSNAALNDIFQKVMARGDVDERYLVRLGAGEKTLQTDSSHDFTKQGRVSYSLARRGILLEQVQLLSESLGISGRAERGADGAPAYTCETADYFNRQQVQLRIRKFTREVENADAKALFPFAAYFKVEGKDVSNDAAKTFFARLADIFGELAEYRPLELLRSQRQRSDYLIMKQARVVAMTCTHAAIARSHLIELGFEYDNVVVEEAGQMLEIESFIPLLLQRGEAEGSAASTCRLKRVSLMGDHNQLPPVIQNQCFAKYSSLDQSLFARLIRLGVPHIQLDKQGRARPEIASLYSWRYENNLGNLDHVDSGEYSLANAGLARTFQLVNVENFEGKGEASPTAHFFQNVGEAEYVVALFQYLVLIGHSPRTISVLTTYNGQRSLINDILAQRCGFGTPLAGVKPRAVSTVDQYQGQQNDIVLLSLVRTEHVGHLRDVRRLIVAVSRARLGLYVFCRQELFATCPDLKRTFDQFGKNPSKLQLLIGENYPTDRKATDTVAKTQLYEVDDVEHMGSIVHQMQEELLKKQG